MFRQFGSNRFLGQPCESGGHQNTTTFTAGLTVRGLVAPMVIDGAMDGAALRA